MRALVQTKLEIWSSWRRRYVSLYDNLPESLEN